MAYRILTWGSYFPSDLITGLFIHACHIPLRVEVMQNVI